MPGTRGSILVVEDDEAIRHVVRLALQREGYTVAEAAAGEEGLRLLDLERPVVVLLDIMLPGMDGWEVCKVIRARSKVPVIMLTARVEEADRVLGLELGADDYVVKPFSPRELVARIKAVLRRAGPWGDPQAPESGKMEYPGLSIDPVAHEVRVSGTPLHLTPKEFDLLTWLARRPGQAFTKTALLEAVWGYEMGDERTVTEHIKRLRHKMGDTGRRYIKTVWGIGYKFSPHSQAEPGAGEGPV